MQETEWNGPRLSAHPLLLEIAAVNTDKRRNLVNHLAEFTPGCAMSP